MANHKRHRPKHQRAGCLHCKPYKDERSAQEEKASVQRQLDPEEQWLWDNEEALAAVQQGLEESANGQTEPMEDFTVDQGP